MWDRGGFAGGVPWSPPVDGARRPRNPPVRFRKQTRHDVGRFLSLHTSVRVGSNTLVRGLGFDGFVCLGFQLG